MNPGAILRICSVLARVRSFYGNICMEKLLKWNCGCHHVGLFVSRHVTTSGIVIFACTGENHMQTDCVPARTYLERNLLKSDSSKNGLEQENAERKMQHTLCVGRTLPFIGIVT